MRSRAISTMLLLVCVAGCSFDFTDLPRDEPAHFFGEVLADSRSGQLTLSAGVEPGHDFDGTRRTVLEDMRLGDVTIEPSHITEDGTRMYEAEWSLTDAVSATGLVLVRAPLIEGLESLQQQPAPRVTLRIGPDSLFVTGDEPAVLRIDFNPPAEDVSVNWHVILSDSIRGSHRSIQGSGPPPQELVIPRNWLDPRTQRYEVRMELICGQQGEFILDRYFWTIITRSRIYWTVILDQS